MEPDPEHWEVPAEFPEVQLENDTSNGSGNINGGNRLSGNNGTVVATASANSSRRYWGCERLQIL